MKNLVVSKTARALVLTLVAGLALAASPAAQAEVVTINVVGTLGIVDGSYAPDLVLGQAISATFVYETDESLAGPGSQTTPSTEAGHEFTSFHAFASPPYGATVTIPSIPATFMSETAAVIVNDDLPMLSADLNGAVPDGNYDWLELLGSTTIDGPNGNPADGEEWTFAMFTSTDWITDGSVIPDGVPTLYTPVLVGTEFDAEENEIGFVWVDITSVTIVPEPVSGAILLGLAAPCLFARRRKAS